MRDTFRYDNRQFLRPVLILYRSDDRAKAAEAGTGMLSLTVSRNSGQPLADQIVAGIKRQIDDRHLRPGTKLPSIRSFAETYNVSRFTVVEAYGRLVAMGCVQSRRGAGFYTAAAAAPTVTGHP